MMCALRDKSKPATGDPDTNLKLSHFDAVTSFFFALLMFLAVFVLLMFVLWILSGAVPPLRLAEVRQPRPDGGPDGLALDFEPPGQEEIEELLEPSLAETLEAVTDAASSVSAAIAVDGNANVSSAGVRGGNRSPGTDQNIGHIVPTWKRWEITFGARSARDYARQLDYFGIELAAFGGGENAIEYANHLSTQPTRRINRNPESETRLYFSWKLRNPLLLYDRQLLSEAGIETRQRNVVRFIPELVETNLWELEQEHCRQQGRRFPDSILKTVFESRPTSDSSFEFRVIDQRYR